MLAPLSQLQNVTSVKVLREDGRILQRSQVEHVDTWNHVPLQLVTKYRHYFEASKTFNSLDFTMLRRALHDSQLRQ